MKKIITILIFAILVSFKIFSNYPEIKNLHKSDQMFLQLQYELEEYYKRAQSGLDLIPISIYSYRCKETDSIFSISSRLNITYDSIITLNGIENPNGLNPGDLILIPNSPGIFIRKNPVGKFEELISLRDVSTGQNLIINKTDNSNNYCFLPGFYLNNVERSYFFKNLFKNPLDSFIRTSGFGLRNHPINKKRSFHTGIDFRASTGSPVYASRDGIISETGMLGNYGLYIIMKHNGGYETVYSHLNKINVKVNDIINSGQIIAESGNTGISTGPHLHFEIRKNGIPLNPENFFPGDS